MGLEEGVPSLNFVFMVVFLNDTDVLVQSENGTSQEERLGDIVEQSACHVVNRDHLISHQCDAAHDEQHRTGILRDFKAHVFHSIFF